MARIRRSDAGMSRFPVLFALVGVIFAATVVSLVLIHNKNNNNGARMVADRSLAAGAPAIVSSAAPTTAATSPAISTAPKSAAPKAAPKIAPTPRSTGGVTAAARTATYVVHQGDNLTVIARWFKLHGYGDLYERNKAVIGSNPDLIRPGQKITVSANGMTSTR